MSGEAFPGLRRPAQNAAAAALSPDLRERAGPKWPAPWPLGDMSAVKENPCRKFQANIFNKSKCQNCFKPRESHLLNDEDLTQVSCRGVRSWESCVRVGRGARSLRRPRKNKNGAGKKCLRVGGWGWNGGGKSIDRAGTKGKSSSMPKNNILSRSHSSAV